jgi:hypothetical protein
MRLKKLRQEAQQMTKSKKNSADKVEIVAQIADLSRLLGMIPNDDTVIVNEPMTHKSMELSKWLSETRNSFLRLSIQLDEALDLNLR